MTYAYNPDGAFTATHQMTLNGKRHTFTVADFRACARAASMKRGRAETILDEVRTAVGRWPEFADDAGVAAPMRDRIGRAHRLEIPPE